LDPLPPERFGLARVDAAALAALREAVGAERVLTDLDERARYAGDETEALRVVPDAALVPQSAGQVAAALRVAHERRLPIVPRGAGTGLSAGALPVCGGVVLSLERMNAIRAVDERDLIAEVEAGAVTGDVQRRVESLGLFYPPDPSSRDSCTLGGNLAADAAGPRSAKYGTTRRWVLGLEVVLADGTPLVTGSRCRKDATGFDLTQLLIGSEGTLAVITAATLRLVAKPRATLTAVVPFAALESAAAAVERLFSGGVDPAACELMEAAALAAVARLEPLPPPFLGSGALLLVELDGDDPAALEERAARLEGLCRALGGGEAMIAADAAGQRRLWQVRRRIGVAVKSLSVYKEADTVVPRSRLVELVRAARAAAGRHGLEAIVYGHAGDGNLHVNLLKGELAEDSWKARRDAAEAELFRAVVDLGGRITGEHGVGWTQRRYLPLALAPAGLALLRGLKRTFDPRGILNPGKIFPDE
jgi:glycolate oxidase